MDFNKSLKRFLSKTSDTSKNGATELASIDLSAYSDYWDTILNRLVSQHTHYPSLESALSKIGDKITPLLKTKLRELKGRKIAPVLRVLGQIIGKEGKDLYLKYTNKSGIIRNTALKLFAEFFPEEASNNILKVAQTDESWEIILALLFLNSREGYLRVQEICQKLPYRLEITFDFINTEVLTNIAQLAIEQLNSELSPLPHWPFESIFINAAIEERLPQISEQFLIASTRSSVGWVARNAIISLARKNNSIGLQRLKENCLNDIFSAKEAFATCERLGTESFFDWFSTKLTEIPTDKSLLSLDMPYGYVINHLYSIVQKDKRWVSWGENYHDNKYLYLKPLLGAVKPPEHQIDSQDIKEVLSALEKFACQKSPRATLWIRERLSKKEQLSREEYFSIIEALRLLSDATTKPLVQSTIEKFQPTGFAKDFGEDVLRGLE